MTPALVCAACAERRSGVANSCIRCPLVRPGWRGGWHAQQAMLASAARLRLERPMAPYLAAWIPVCVSGSRRRGCSPFASAVNALDAGAPATFVLVLSRATRSLGRLRRTARQPRGRSSSRCAGRRGRTRAATMLPTLRLLSSEAAPRRHPARLFDLWLSELLDLLSIRNNSILAHGFDSSAANLHGNGWSGGRRIDSSRYWTTTRRRPA